MKQKHKKFVAGLIALGLVLLFPYPNLLWLAYKITSLKYPCLNQEFGCGANDYGFMVLDKVFIVWIVLAMIWAISVSFLVVLLIKHKKRSKN